MHFLLVVTEEKPTEDLIAQALTPFGPDGERRWGWWALGGCFSGNLIPIDLRNTVTGGFDVSDFEISLGYTIIPRLSGPGVDALQIKNLKRQDSGISGSVGCSAALVRGNGINARLPRAWRYRSLGRSSWPLGRSS